MKNVYAKIGFTLAEVLITLGIIGIVAAITIPGLINTNKAHKLRAQFLKSYSTIQQVFKRMETDDLSLNPKDYKDNASYYKTFKQYLNGATDCGEGGMKLPKPCRAYGYKGDNDYKNLLGGAKFLTAWLDDGSLLLQDGTILFFENNNSDFILISVDLNGFVTPPNRAGYDLFTFQFVDGEIKVMGDKGTKYENDVERHCNTYALTNNQNGITCAYKAKNDPEYFKRIVRLH